MKQELVISHQNEKHFMYKRLPKLVEDIQYETFDEFINDSDNLREGIEKYIVPSNIIDIYTRLENILGLKLSGHTDTSTEARNLIHGLYKRGETQNEQQNKSALDKYDAE